MKLAYSHINLRFNPFGELNAEQRQHIAVVNIDSVKETLAESVLENKKVAIQFLADHGRGKTTHLLALHKYFPECEYTKLFSGDNPLFNFQSLRFIDSVENLCSRQRRKLYKKSTSIVCTTHTDLSSELKAAGYKVFKKIISLHDEAVLKQVLNQRIEYSRRTSDAIPVIDTSLVRNLKARYGDDIRSMEYHLYEVFQSLERIEHVKM